MRAIDIIKKNHHIVYLMKKAKEYGVKQVYVHSFLDGRDVPPTSGKGYVEKLQENNINYQDGGNIFRRTKH